MSHRLPAAAVLVTAGLLAAGAARAQNPLPRPTACPAKECQARLVLRSYPVAELVVPVAGTPADSGKKDKPGKPTATREEDLIKTIEKTVAPETWASHGGRATIEYFPLTMTLVVNQTPDVHEQVAELLEKLSREQNTEVALEVRLVSVPESFLERVGVDFNVRTDGTGAQCPVRMDTKVTRDPLKCLPEQGAFLTDKQLFQFMEAIQGDQRSRVMSSPKIVALDGQTAYVDCTDKQSFVTAIEAVQRDGRPVVTPKSEEVVTGFRMSACPRISADRRSVLLSLDINQTDLASPAVPLFPITVQAADDQGKPVQLTQFLQQPKVNTIRIEKKLTIPDGGTVLLGGLKKVVEVRNEYGPPVLTKVPYVSRLFKNVECGQESQRVYVLVTPRIIVNEPQGGAEESEPRPPTSAVAPPDRPTKALAELLKAYDEACAAGQTKQAAKFAQAALILDPTCFARPRQW
jgi:general secretion pathway protein D